MIRMTAKVRFDAGKVLAKAKNAAVKSLAHAAAGIRLIARRSIRRSPNPSAPGTPPHTRKGRLKGAILYSVDQASESAVIGPSHQGVGTSGSAHEFGGMYKGERYDKRPFMGPALQKELPKLPKHWAHSIK